MLCKTFLLNELLEVDYAYVDFSFRSCKFSLYPFDLFKKICVIVFLFLYIFIVSNFDLLKKICVIQDDICVFWETIIVEEADLFVTAGEAITFR